MKTAFGIKEKKEMHEKYLQHLKTINRFLNADRFKMIPTLQNVEARNEFNNGLVYRFRFIKHCIEQILEISPPERTEHLHEKELYSLNVLLHEILTIVGGGIDNLSEIHCLERNIDKKKNKLSPMNINFFSKKYYKFVQKELFWENIKIFRGWHSFIKKYKNPTSHSTLVLIFPAIFDENNIDKFEKEYQKIHRKHPLPYEKTRELYEKYGRYEPIYKNSNQNNKEFVYFHHRNIVDIGTFLLITEYMFEEMGKETKLN